MKRWGVLGAAAVVTVVSMGPARAALLPVTVGPAPTPVQHGQILGVSSDVLDFSGSLTNPTPLPTLSDPEPQVCAAAADCQEWNLKVGTAEPFLVSIHNGPASAAFNPNDGLNLYVYDAAGNQAASSAGIGSNGQAAAVTPPPGTGPARQADYTLVVTVTYAYDATVDIEGEARVMAGASWAPATTCASAPCPVLPTLEALPPSDFHVSGLPPVPSTPVGFPFPVDTPTPTSCYAEETANTGATRCLRFTSDVRDAGVGPLQLSWDWADTSQSPPRTGFAPGQCQATQIVVMSDGSTTTRPAGNCEFHLQHGHFHYDNLVRFGLFTLDATGAPATAVGSGLKESFCLADDDYFGFGSATPNGPRQFSGQPGCSAPRTVGPSGAYGLMGISSGWGDVYSWDTPDQFIDITKVPDGTYEVVSEVNPNAVLLTTAGPGVPGPCSARQVTLANGTVTEGPPAASLPCPTDWTVKPAA